VYHVLRGLTQRRGDGAPSRSAGTLIGFRMTGNSSLIL
jgi:hypothetical protein